MLTLALITNLFKLEGENRFHRRHCDFLLTSISHQSTLSALSQLASPPIDDEVVCSTM